MRIQVRGDHLEVTPALREYAEKKIGRLEKYFSTSNVQDAHVTLAVANSKHTVEVTMPLNGILLRAEERTSDMYASIDLVSDKLEKQIEKHKSKINRRMKQEGLKTLFKDGSSATKGSAVSLQEVEDPSAEQLVRTKRFAFKPMVIDEAILQMDLLGHDFFVFSNSESEEVNVVYKRKDGHYGLIEPTF
jgi:putative sigma-54 modulation protein